MHLRFLESGWTTEQKQKLLSVLTEAKGWEGGSSYTLYLSNAARDFARNMSLEESLQVLRRGGEWPDAALGALYRLPQQLNDAQRSVLQELDRELDGRHDPPSQRLMVGIVAVLARSGDDASMAYLREIWDRNPERREPVAMGLAQVPGGANWEYLIRSLPILENVTAQEVLQRLATVDRVPDNPEHIRQIILCGLRLDRAGAEDAAACWRSGRVTTRPSQRRTGSRRSPPGRSGSAMRSPICPTPACPSRRRIADGTMTSS